MGKTVIENSRVYFKLGDNTIRTPAWKAELPNLSEYATKADLKTVRPNMSLNKTSLVSASVSDNRHGTNDYQKSFTISTDYDYYVIQTNAVSTSSETIVGATSTTMSLSLSTGYGIINTGSDVFATTRDFSFSRMYDSSTIYVHNLRGLGISIVDLYGVSCYVDRNGHNETYYGRVISKSQLTSGSISISSDAASTRSSDISIYGYKY